MTHSTGSVVHRKRSRIHSERRPRMHCPYCRSTDTRVVDSRVAEDGGSIRRRRTCAAESCGKRFTTVELMQLVVQKRSGATEPFTREKAIAGVRKACKGRPVSEDDARVPGPGRRGRAAPERRRRGPRPRGGPGDPRPAPRARPGRLPPLRQRLPRLRVGRRLRGRDRDAPARGGEAATPAHGLTQTGPACVVGKLHAPGHTKHHRALLGRDARKKHQTRTVEEVTQGEQR